MMMNDNDRDKIGCIIAVVSEAALLSITLGTECVLIRKEEKTLWLCRL